MDKDFRLAELNPQGEAIEAIRKLEQQLTEAYGSEVALIAYAAETGNEQPDQH